MSDIAITVLMTLITVLVGSLSGWWLGTRSKPGAMRDSDEVRRARDTLTSLHRLSSMVACDVGEHQDSVEAISDELTCTDEPPPDQILNAVTRLVEANQKMQGKLDQAEDRLREQARLVESHTAEARTDALTLLGNRRAFDEELEQMFDEYQSSGRRFGLAMLDFDRFKSLNDNFGHQAGDEVLRAAGRVVRRTIGAHDSAARYGGEEFAILLAPATHDEMKQTVRRIRSTIERTPFLHQGAKMPVTVSIGIAECNDDASVAELIQRADSALYASKADGRNCAHWHTGHDIVKITDAATAERMAPPVVEAPPAPVAVAIPAEPAAPPAVTPHAPAWTEKHDTAPISDESLGLTNRTAFCQFVRSRLAEWKRGGTTVSLVLMQIDGADAFGRKYGIGGRDVAIATMANSVAAGVRAMDLAARYTPNSISFILPQASLADASIVAERVRKSACETSPQGMELCVSMGMVEVSNVDDIVTLFRRAEQAVEAAESKGGNSVYHHDGRKCVPALALA